MASDTEDVTTRAALVSSIRDKIAEYKAFLLRQLLEQRDALVALDSSAGADKESGEREEKERKDEKINITTAPDAAVDGSDDTTADRNGKADDADVVAVIGDDDSNGEVSASSPASSSSSAVAAAEDAENESNRHRHTNGRAVDRKKAEAITQESAEVSDIKVKSGGDPTDTTATAISPTFAKRRIAETSSVSAKHAKSGGVTDDNVDRKKRSRENLAADATAILEQRPATKRVVRTSVPSRKYLDESQHRHRQEFSGRTGVQPMLISSDGHSADGQNSQLNHRAPPRELTMEQIHGDFEKQLRDSVRISKEVGSRSLSMTRKRQLPRLATPSRQKSHWDYLLEEMKWMATDFSQERNWKRAMQFHLAKDVIVAQNAEKVRQEKENRQLAREIALQVSAFWRSMERIAARSRVRFEASGSGDVSKDSELSSIAKEKQATEMEAIENAQTGVDENESGVVLKYKKIDVESGSTEERCIISAKEKMKRILSAGRKGREALLFEAESEDSNMSSRESALEEVQSRLSSVNGSRTILAAFQVMALRWMLELYTAGLNMFLNDQLGMGKAATISAFLSLVSVLDAQSAPSPTKSSEGEAVSGPHLVIVAEEELHKWQFNLRVWRREWRVQLYEGTAGYRKQLQREWKKKSSTAASSETQFLNDSEGEELWEEENQPVFCVLCPVSAFAEDHDDFVQFSDWQMLVVENEFDDLFEDPKILAALKHIPQQSRRILCNGRSVENWKSLALRNQYAEFLLRNGSNPESEEWSLDAWTNLLLLDKPSAAQAMQSCGKTSNAVVSLFKSAQQENQSHVGALLVAMYCLGLRRVRSEVESQLGKIEEQSISCKLSGSQMTQYRNAISGFAASISTMHEREERLEMWLHLFLRLRVICNCVDIVNDLDKLALADMRVIASCSTKLDALSSLLTRLVNKEEKRVVIYCQFNGMFPILEMCLTLLDVSFVRIAGSVHMQRRALSHFAERLAVKVALASTRLSCAQGTRAVSVYGADAIVVLDSDWNAICDAKLRACWAKTAVGKELVPVYRLHCEQTIEASLLRVGACFSEKVFGEMTPQELLAVPSDLLVGNALEKPSWWTSNANPGTSAANVIAKLGDVAQQAEEEEKYCGDDSELEKPLIVHNIDLDAEEHLLLSNTDELTPVEWYAVNYVHGLTDKKRVNHGGDGSGIHEDEHSSEGWTEAHYLSNAQSFDELVTLENKHTWQDGDTEQQLFYQQVDSADAFAPVDEKTIEKLFSILRAKGMETHYNLYLPPQPPIAGQKEVFCEPGTTDGNQMMFHVSYRVPAPPVPPAPVKIKSEQSSQVQQSDTPMKAVKVKKPRNSSANVTTTGPAIRPSGTAPSATAVAGVKRKLEQQSGGVAGVKTPSTKEQRVDLEGIPLPDVAEFEDDDFWGDTNLDALDSASWDDASVLSGILGPTVDSSSSTKTSTGAGTASASQDGTTVPAQRPPKKTKGPTGAGATSTNRARKGSVSSDSGRDGWSSQDDMVLKKLFELYGSNWTLIAQVFNSTTAVSRFFCKKRSPRQCYDRYGKIISGSLSGNSSGNSSGVKDGKTSKASKASAASAALISPEMLDARIGLPADEMLLVFSARNSLPGLPPPSIVNVPNLVEMSMRKKKMQKQLPVNSPGSGDAGGMDDLKSIRNSFDAIIQCMKRKTAPPPIPIPTASTSTSDFSMKASLTATGAASFTPSPASKAAKASNSQSLAAKKAAAAPPPPHKSHMDIITLLPAGPVAPDDVIKRSKEVAAVQAAAAVASVGRDVSPLSAAGDAILGAAFGSSTSLNRKQAYAGGSVGGMTSGAGSTGNGVNSRGPVSGIAHNVPGAKLATPSAGIAASTSVASTSSPAWGDMSSLHHMARGVGGSMSTIDLNSSSMIGGSGLAPGGGGLSVVGAGTPGSSGSVAGGGSGSKPPIPVTTSTLLHVLDRMPEIKNKIQTILNRNDCSEAQKVTMIARLLSNTNAINNSNVMPTSGGSTPTSSLASTQGMPNHQSNAVSVVSSSVMAMAGGIETSTSASSAIIDLETPIPMPASLASAPTPTSSHMPANAALLMESLATSPVSTPNSYPPNPTQP